MEFESRPREQQKCGCVWCEARCNISCFPVVLANSNSKGKKGSDKRYKDILCSSMKTVLYQSAIVWCLFWFVCPWSTKHNSPSPQRVLWGGGGRLNGSKKPLAWLVTQQQLSFGKWIVKSFLLDSGLMDASSPRISSLLETFTVGPTQVARDLLLRYLITTELVTVLPLRRPYPLPRSLSQYANSRAYPPFSFYLLNFLYLPRPNVILNTFYLVNYEWGKCDVAPFN